MKKMNAPISLESLPDDIGLHICSYVAADDPVKDLFNLQLVSKSFRRLGNEPYVLRRVYLARFPIDPWFESEDCRRGWTSFLHKCAKAGNMAAKCRLGLVEYFLDDSDDEQRKERLQRLADDPDKEAQFYY